MKKKLYYVVEKELETIGDVLEATGNTTLTLYEINDNIPIVFATIESTIDENHKSDINEYLEDNGYGDDIFELIQL
jgi:hypothetical protein